MLPLEGTPLVTLKLLPRNVIPSWLPSEFNSIISEFRLARHRLSGRPNECNTCWNAVAGDTAGEVMLGVRGHSVMYLFSSVWG